MKEKVFIFFCPVCRRLNDIPKSEFDNKCAFCGRKAIGTVTYCYKEECNLLKSVIYGQVYGKEAHNDR